MTFKLKIRDNTGSRTLFLCALSMNGTDSDLCTSINDKFYHNGVMKTTYQFYV